jgi:vancomycin permeability regulator SanA
MIPNDQNNIAKGGGGVKRKQKMQKRAKQATDPHCKTEKTRKKRKPFPWRAVLGALARFFRRACAACGVLFVLGLLLFLILLSISGAVCHKTQDRIVTPDSLETLDVEFDYILILGCSVRPDGSMSAMLRDRVDTGIALYDRGICDMLLMSGDSASVGYDEVGTMKQAAIDAGVLESAIVTDPLGLSTYDSVSRLFSQFNGKRVLIVTQGYHLHRALYIADKLGIDALGVSADLRPYAGQWKRDLREILARVKDVYLSLQQP